MPKDVADTDEFRGARFTRVDLSGATLRDVDLTDAKIVDAVLVNADVSGLIIGLRVNGVDVAPVVEAELDRRHPERVVMRATTALGMRQGGAAVEAMWAPTIELAMGLPELARHQRVDDEWSLIETLRHLIFVTNARRPVVRSGARCAQRTNGPRPRILGYGDGRRPRTAGPQQHGRGLPAGRRANCACLPARRDGRGMEPSPVRHS